MLDFFEIAGSHIKYADIKEFKLVQREYIFRPTYAETNNILKGVFGSKYEFSGMQPYAAIIDETSHKFSTSEYKAKNMNESVVKDLFEGTMTTIGDKFNIKALRSVKYHCINQAGRRFTKDIQNFKNILYEFLSFYEK